MPHFKAPQYDLGPNLLATHFVNWVKLKWVTWRTNNIVTVDILEETSLPTFSLIETILLNNNNEVYVYSLLFETLSFDEHYCAYEVQRTKQYHCFPCKNAISPCPNTLTLMRNLSNYVTTRWTLD